MTLPTHGEQPALATNLAPRREPPVTPEARRPDRASAVTAVVLAAMFLIGQAAGLRLVQVRPYAVFQHYVPWSDALAEPIAFLALVAQTAICLIVAGPAALAAVARGIGRILGRWRVLIAAGALAFALAVPTESVQRFAGELLLGGWIAAIAGLNLVLAARAVPARVLAAMRNVVSARVTLESGTSGDRPWDRRLPWIAALVVAVLAALSARIVFDGVPHIDDSVTYLFQAKYLSLGRLHLPAPPDAESFAVNHLIQDGDKWYGKFFPGWPALLSLAVLAGVPWLLNPLLAAAALLLAHALVMRLYDRGTANGATLLLAASPWFLFTSSEMMSHAASLAWGLLALLAIDLQRGRRVGRWSLAAGVALGALYLTRPFDAVLLGPVAALWAWGVAGRRLSFGSLATIALVAGAVAGLMLPYNAALSGQPLLAPHRLWADVVWGPGIDVLGFGRNIGIPLWRDADPIPGHGFADVVLNMNKNVFSIGFELFGWATGSLVLAVLACLLGPWRRSDAVMLGIVIAVVGGHVFYWAPGGPDLGSRYWYLTIVPLVVLTVRGAQMLSARLGAADAQREGRASETSMRVGGAILVASVSAVVCVLPWRAVTKYHRYRDIGGEVRELKAGGRLDHGLVFVRSPSRSEYQSAFNFNPPRLAGPDPIFALDAGPEHRAAVVRSYPDRPIWIIGPPPTGAGKLVILEGPLPAGANPPGAAYEYEHSLQANLKVR